jgi:hypothetical protein
MINDGTAGMLKLDAVDPMFWVEGFKGRILGMAIVTLWTLCRRKQTSAAKTLTAPSSTR